MTTDTPGRLAQFWSRIPVLLRAFLTGILVFELLQLPQFLILANVHFLPEWPWTTPMVLIGLWLSWRYFSGSGWPCVTKRRRKILMRSEPTENKRRFLGWCTVVPAVFTMLGLAIVSSSLIAFPAASFEPPTFLLEFPAATAFWIIVAFSVAAGVSEEAGFRGYMQVPLEEHYGPLIAILFTAVVFWLAHFSSASFLHRAPLLIGAGILAGAISYQARSLIPAVVIHSLADIIGFTTVTGLFGLAPVYTSSTVWETGYDGTFITGLALLLSGLAVSIYLLRRLSLLE